MRHMYVTSCFLWSKIPATIQVLTRFIVGLGKDREKSSLNIDCCALILERHFKTVLQDCIFYFLVFLPESKLPFQKAPP